MKSGFYLLFIVFLLLNNSLFSQSAPDEHLRKKVIFLMERENWYEALTSCQQLYEQQPDDPEINYMLGVCYQKNKRVDKSLPYLKKAQNQSQPSEDIDYYLGRAYQFNLRFDSAIFYLNRYLAGSVNHENNYQYLDQARRNIEECVNGKKFYSDSLDLKIINVGPVINSPYPEYVPLVTPDESTLIFTSRRQGITGGKMDKTGQYMEDIYLSHKDINGNWLKPDNNLPFNSRGHDACVGLSVDGNTLIIYQPTNSGDLYLSNFNGKKWSKPSKIKGDVNSTSWESSASITLDGKYIYFTSDKPGGYGGSDIYVAEKLNNSKWGNVRNLGPVINTPYDEDAPQIHGDNVTLFFSSKGHNTMGGFDVFSSVYNSNDLSWSQPRNIGYPINTPGDDIYFFLVADGSKGYFSSFREDSYGEKDIYEIQRPESSPSKFVMKIKIHDPFRNKPVKADIFLTDIQSGDTVKFIKTDFENGNYSCVLDFEKKYTLNVIADGYAFQEKDINISYRADIFEYDLNIVPKKEELVDMIDTLEAKYISEMPASNPVKEAERVKRSLDPGIRTVNKINDPEETGNGLIFVTRIDTRERIIINEIQFAFNSAAVNVNQEKSLSDLSSFLQKSPNIHFIISGHTDSIGNDKYNEDLSYKRTVAVKKLLISDGIPDNRIHVKGMGDYYPIASNQSSLGRMINRRVDILIIDVFDKKYVQGIYADLLQSYHIPFQILKDYSTPYLVNELIPVSIHFSENSSRLTDYSSANIALFANYLNQIPFNVVLFGVVDANEVKPQTLIEKRAGNVRQYLFNAGIKQDRIIVLSPNEARQYSTQLKYAPGIYSRTVQCILIKN